MKAVETPPKALAQSPTLLQGSSRNSDPGSNSSKDASKISPVKNTRENGVRVSLNRNEDFGGHDLVVSVVGTQVSAEKDMGDKVNVNLDLNDGGLEDSEMNGVSSLLKMQKSKSLRGLGSVLDVIDKDEMRGFESSDGVSLVADVCGDVHSNNAKEKRHCSSSLRDESLDVNEGYPGGKTKELDECNDMEEKENMGDEEHEYAVGDFVWGKIRSHPWWPGRIYDPMDASDCAKKIKQRDKILVAYFGDGTFAWCNPSQLKLLYENFLEMSNQSSSKNFAHAVENAMDEVGRLVDLKMTCCCVPKDNLIGFGRTLAVNAGIKEGLLIPAGGIHKFSSALFEPAELLSALKGAAQTATIMNMLEFTVLKSWLSAFYRARGGHQLPSYYDPKPIPGLEDKSRNWTVDLSDHNGMEVIIQGPQDEPWHSSPGGPKYGQTAQNVLHKCQGVSEDGHYQRKQKSLAEIMEGHTDFEAAENKNKVSGGGKMSSQATSSAKRRKRKFEGENMGAEGENELIDLTQGTNLGKPTSTSGRKKGKSDKADYEGKYKMEDAAEAGTNLGKLQPSSDRKRRKGSGEADVVNNGRNDSKTKTRKGTKLSESLAAVEADSSGSKNKSMKSPSSRGRKKGDSKVKVDGGGGKDEEMMDGSPSNKAKTAEQNKEDSLHRERKRSKYLSPPYTNINKGQSKKEIEAESMKVSSEARLGERLTKAACHLIGSQNQHSKETVAGHETTDSSGLQTPKQDQIFDPLIVKVPANEVLSEIRSAALNPLYLKDSNSLYMVGEFFSAFRSLSYSDGSYGEYSEHRPARKKSQKSEPGPVEKERSQTACSSPDHKSSRTKTKKSEVAKLDGPIEKQAASAPLDMKIKDKESNGEAPGAALLVTFGPGSSLPSKNDLIKIYGKSVALNEQETNMFYNNRCAKVVFLRSSEAEEAFNHSQLSSPFGRANVTFRLRYPSAETKTRELREISRNKPSSLTKEGAKAQGIPSASQSSDSNVSQLNFIKQKLEMVTSLLETSVGKISPDIKSILESEIKVVLEKVSTMVSSS